MTVSNRPFVSVIIPVFNNPEGIAVAINSLLGQSYPSDSYEVIVSDNGSTDETRQVVGQAMRGDHDIIKLVEERETQTSYAARNKAIGEAKGEILAFTDSDCVPSEHWIELGVAALDAEQSPCGGGRIEFTYVADRPNIFEYLDSARKLNQELYTAQGFAATANFFARKDLFDRYGLFRSDLVSGGDYEFGKRVTNQGDKLIYIPEAIVHHPARNTFGEIYRKSKRVASGEKQLRQLGLLEHKRLVWRQLLPTKSWPVEPRWAPSLSVADKLKLIFFQTLLRWVNFAARLG